MNSKPIHHRGWTITTNSQSGTWQAASWRAGVRLATGAGLLTEADAIEAAKRMIDAAETKVREA